MMKNLKISLTIASIGIFSLIAQSAHSEGRVGVVIQLKGKAEIVGTSTKGKKIKLKRGAPVFEGDRISTEKSASVRVMLQDQSVLSVGGGSEIEVKQAKNEGDSKPGVVSLVNGKLRALITKPPKELERKPSSDEGKSRFIVETPNAIMGVRGTEFQANYNSKIQLSSVVTFEGLVEMGKSIEGGAKVVDPISVSAGHYTQTKADTLPAQAVKINPAQFSALKRQANINSSTESGSTKVTTAPKAAATIPPGVEAGSFAPPPVSEEGQGVKADAGPPPSSMGAVDNRGVFTPPPGGFVDPDNGLYIPPPPGSMYDSQTGTFVPPPAMGSVDPDTGGFRPPNLGGKIVYDQERGFVVNREGAVDPQSGRQPSSNDAGGALQGVQPSDAQFNQVAGMIPPGMMEMMEKMMPGMDEADIQQFAYLNEIHTAPQDGEGGLAGLPPPDGGEAGDGPSGCGFCVPGMDLMEGAPLPPGYFDSNFDPSNLVPVTFQIRVHP